MKKFILTILVLVYITTSTGAAIHMHYCMGKLADWGLGHNESDTCSKCGMEQSKGKDNGCCKDEHKFIKNDADQKKAETSFQLMQLTSVVIPSGFIEIPAAEFIAVTEENPVSHAPPRNYGIAVYLRNCVFLI
jgi:hypothetical protein